jgi:hypothetical protein
MMVDLKKQLQRLYFHPGFPNGDKLQCPIFTQDKFRYITYCNKTIAIRLNELGVVDNETKIFIEKFTTENSEGVGWVVKAPYTTNCQFREYSDSLEKILICFKSACHKFYGFHEYVMIQPRMFNSKEIRVMLFNEKARYFININSETKSSKRILVTDDELFRFAEDSVNMIKQNLGDKLIFDGPLRVDMFQKSNGELVVNEFESLEANYDCSNHVTEIKMRSEMMQYWKCKIFNAIKNLYYK